MPQPLKLERFTHHSEAELFEYLQRLKAQAGELAEWADHLKNRLQTPAASLNGRIIQRYICLRDLAKTAAEFRGSGLKPLKGTIPSAADVTAIINAAPSDVDPLLIEFAAAIYAANSGANKRRFD